MTASALGDRFGRRRWFAAGLALFALASAACALAPSVGALIAARAVQGVGAALVMPLALALVGAAFPPERRGAAIGALQGLTGLSVASGPVIGGAVAQGIAWQWIFWINVPIGAARGAARAARGCPRAAAATRALDLRGVGARDRRRARHRVGPGARQRRRLGQRGGGRVARRGRCSLLGAFIAWEARARAPMLAAGLFRSRAFSAGNAATFLTFAALFAAVFFLAQFLQTGLGYGPLGAGLRLLPWTGDAVLRRAGRGDARRPLRRAAVPRRPGSRCRRSGFAWIALVADPACRTRDRPGADDRRLRRLDGDPVRADRGRQRASRAPRSARPRAATACCASSAACSASPSPSPSSPAPAATRPPQEFSDGFGPAMARRRRAVARRRAGRPRAAARRRDVSHHSPIIEGSPA